MKVGSLFAEIGFKVDESGLEKFSNAMKAFQKTIRDGLKDLREYAKVAREITQAMRDAYVPTQQEARARYRANTRYISSQARRGNAGSKYMRAEAANIAAQATLANERARLMERQTRVRESNAESRAKQVRMKELGLIGTHTGKYSSGIIGLLRGIAGFSLGGIAGGIAGLAGLSHPIVAAISIGIKAVLSAIRWLGTTIREGIRIGLAYRDYARFTGRDTTGIAGLLAATRNATSLTPMDVMKDIQGLESGFWDMWFGGGNPRLWQMLGILPTGNGETDMMNLLGRIYGVTGGFKNGGLARSLLKQAGLSEDYINVFSDFMKNNPSLSLKELQTKSMAQIRQIEEGNRIMREFDETIRQIKVDLVASFIGSGLLDVVRELAKWIAETTKELMSFVNWIRSIFPKQKEKPKWVENVDYYTNPLMGPSRLVKSLFTGEWGVDAAKEAIKKGSGVSNSNSNNVSIDSHNNYVFNGDPSEEAKSSVESIEDRWWGRISETTNATLNAAKVGEASV